MSRRLELEARRRVLLAHCDTQRAELSQRFARLRSAGVLGLPTLGSASGRAGADLTHHPLAWVIAIGGLLLLGRTREVLKMLVWARAALGVASRVTQVVRLIASLRAPRTRHGRASEPPARSAS